MKRSQSLTRKTPLLLAPPPAHILDSLTADCASGKSDYVSVPVSVLLQMIAVCRTGAE